MSPDFFAMLADQIDPPEKSRKWATPGMMAMSLDPPRGKRAGVRTTPALDHIDKRLCGLFDEDETDRLMIFMAPQEGKSEKVSFWTPIWLLEHDPTLRIAIVSFEARKAERWGKRLLRAIKQFAPRGLGIRLRRDSQSVQRFETVEGGSVICVGIEGGITGEPVDVLIIDDPIRGRAEAESETYREKAWDWWESNGFTRLSERGKVILMMTRWHEDDMAGRLLQKEPEEWEVLSIPAVVNEPDEMHVPVIVGEEVVGYELISVRGRKPGYFLGLKERRSAYVFSSIYQQTPTPAEGGMFARGDLCKFWAWSDFLAPAGVPQIDLMGYRDVSIQDFWTFMTVDLAASEKKTADYTVASVWGVYEDELILLDRKRVRAEVTEHKNVVLPLNERWKCRFVGIEDVKDAVTLATDLGRANVTVKRLKPVGDKVTRAIPASNRVKQRRLWLPAREPWLDEFLDEVASFPKGRHDDQVDTLSYAAREIDYGRSTGPVSSGTDELAEDSILAEFEAIVGGTDWEREIF